jgi:hypothetical protein
VQQGARRAAALLALLTARSATLPATLPGPPSQLLVRMKDLGLPLLQGMSMRAEATHVHVKGRVHLGIALTHEAPGIKGVYYVSRGAAAACLLRARARQPQWRGHANEQPDAARGLAGRALGAPAPSPTPRRARHPHSVLCR